MKQLKQKISLVLILFAVILAINLLWFGSMALGGLFGGGDGDPSESTSVYVYPMEENTEEDGAGEDAAGEDAAGEDAASVDGAGEDGSGDDSGDASEDTTTASDIPTASSEKTEDTQKGPEDASKEGLYYRQLSDRAKKNYMGLLSGIEKRQEEIKVKPCPEEELDIAWDSLLNDHVEIFWVDSYQYTTISEEVVSVAPIYVYTKSEISDRQKQIESVVKSCVKAAPSKGSDYDKILYVYKYLVNNTEYSDQSPNNQNVDSVLLGKESVCAGYAKSTKILLNQLGVETYYVTGFAKNDTDKDSDGEGHAWNIVNCQGDYYHVDTTWGDPLYENGAVTKAKDRINYCYLNCNDDEILRTHALDQKFKYPSCNKIKWNYYVVNKRYLEEYDSKEVSSMIKQDIDSGSDYSAFKFSNEKAYKTALKAFDATHFNEGMDYFSQKNNVNVEEYSYSTNDESYLIEVYWNKE